MIDFSVNLWFQCLFSKREQGKTMETSIKLGKIWGIPIQLHFSWFLILGLLTWSLASGYFPQEYPALTPAVHWLLGVVTSFLFAASVLLHELGHSNLALREGIPVKGITLFIFGGVAQITREPRSPGAEFRIASAGPLVSLALAGLFGGLWLLDRAMPVLAAPSLWLARINLSLALFNLIPGFPLDGGRVLRALVWKFTGSLQKATKVASFTGGLVAVGFIGLGVFTIFRGNFIDGLWLAFIGWFLQNAAAASYAQSGMQQALRGVRVSEVMERDLARVDGGISLRQLVQFYVTEGGQRVFFVTQEGGKLRGMLTVHDLMRVPRLQWEHTPVEQAMIPIDRLAAVHPDSELLAALQKMDEADLAQVPVVEDSQLRGLLRREHVLHYVRTRAEIGI
jgi:Zn-dependent protease